MTRPALTLVPPLDVEDQAPEQPAAPPAPAPPAPADTLPERIELPPDWPTALLIATPALNGAGAWFITHDPVTMVCWGLAGALAAVLADRWCIR